MRRLQMQRVALAAALVAVLALSLTAGTSAACEADDPPIMAPELAVPDTVEEAAADSTADAGEAPTAPPQEEDNEDAATSPPECSDMAALAASIRDGSFAPSSPKRWATFAGKRWEPTPPVVPEAAGTPGRCDIERVHGRDVSPDDFKARYLEKQPVIIVNATDYTDFALMTRKDVILYCFADYDVTLSTANKNSYAKTEASFRHYVERMIAPTTINASGVGSKYLFGDNRHSEWDALFRHYRKPSQYIWSYVTLSFGVGGSGSGVPFHTHGHVFAEVFHGRKRWFLQPPGEEPRFDPDETSLRWATLVAPTLPDEDRARIVECVCGPGDLLYIPTHWHHATLNIGESVFMSAFV